MNERERLIKIMNSLELNSKQFSEELGVSAGTISNILGGRNKPSLEVMQNVANHYPFINPTWLFVGFGEMYIDGYIPNYSSNIERDLFSESEVSASKKNNTTTLPIEVQSTKEICQPTVISSNTRTIQKIVVFYSDGTFEER